MSEGLPIGVHQIMFYIMTGALFSILLAVITFAYACHIRPRSTSLLKMRSTEFLFASIRGSMIIGFIAALLYYVELMLVFV